MTWKAFGEWLPVLALCGLLAHFVRTKRYSWARALMTFVAWSLGVIVLAGIIVLCLAFAVVH
jgi:hypothetical protein